MDRVRIGVMGAGWVTQERHLPRLQAVEEADVSLIWSRQRANAEKLAGQFGIPEVVDSWEEIVHSPQVDAVIVSTPPILHSTQTLAALEAGKHVLCQGRMARNLKEALAMTVAAKASGLVAGLYPPFPGLKGDRVIRRLLQEDFVGEIRDVRVSGLALAEPPDDYAWQADPDVVGVNSMTLGLWVEVLNRWVGPASVVTARGKTQTQRRKTVDGDWVEAAVPDSLAIAADLVCGATATYHFSTAAACGPGHAIEIYGSKGALVYQMFAGELSGGLVGETLKPIEIPEKEVRDQTTDGEWVRAILEEGDVSPNFEDGVRYMEFCEAVALSMMEGRRVELPLEEGVMESWGRMLR